MFEPNLVDDCVSVQFSIEVQSKQMFDELWPSKGHFYGDGFLHFSR